MLEVSYKNRIGYCTHSLGNNGKIKTRINICHANCLCAMIYFYKNSEGENIAQLESFFMNVAHAKRLFKESPFLSYFDDFVFNAKELNKDLWKLIQLLADYGKKITIK